MVANETLVAIERRYDDPKDLVTEQGFEPARVLSPAVFETAASAISPLRPASPDPTAPPNAAQPRAEQKARQREAGPERTDSGAEDEGRTRDLLLGKEALYH